MTTIHTKSLNPFEVSSNGAGVPPNASFFPPVHIILPVTHTHHQRAKAGNCSKSNALSDSREHWREKHLAHEPAKCRNPHSSSNWDSCTNYSGGDKSLARPGRKRANVSVRMA